jgi:hypothetical protein
MVQEPLAATVPPVRATEAPPAVAVVVPPQVLVSPLGVATVIPEGSVSVNATLVNAVVLGFVMVNVRLVVLPTLTVDAPNAFANDGVIDMTVMVAVAGGAGGAFEVRVEVVLSWFGATVAPRTLMLMVHEPPAAIAPPDRDTEVPPAVAVAVPPQVLVSALGVATVIAEGRVSVNATLVSPTVVLGFVIVKVRLVVDP